MSSEMSIGSSQMLPELSRIFISEPDAIHMSFQPWFSTNETISGLSMDGLLTIFNEPSAPSSRTRPIVPDESLIRAVAKEGALEGPPGHALMEWPVSNNPISINGISERKISALVSYA